MDVMNQMVLRDIHRHFTQIQEYTFFSVSQEISKFDHILSQRASLHRYKKIKTPPVAYETKNY